MIYNPISIAIADDFVPLKKFLHDYLNSNGFAVVCDADNGEDLVNKLRRKDKLPAMCLLDLKMPVMDGFETAIQLRRYFPSICIMAFSYDDDNGNVQKILKAGADAFICKDSTIQEIRESLKALYIRCCNPSNIKTHFGEVDQRLVCIT